MLGSAALVRTGWSHAFRRAHVVRRLNATVAAPPVEPKHHRAWLFVSGIYPIRLGFLDLRHYLAIAQQDNLLQNLHSILNSVSTNAFSTVKLVPSPKYGGVFIQFECDDASEQGLADIRSAITDEASKNGGLHTWISFLSVHNGEVWPVRGEPWLEDLYRYVSPFVKVEFEGPDVHEEDLYALMRPFGRIHDISAPVPVPAGNLRSSTVAFVGLRSAAAAHSCLHGLNFKSSDSRMTRLKTTFEPARKANWFRDWVVNHPRISLPAAVFLVGTLSYAIFDPIRTLVIQWKMLGRFNFKELSLVKWILSNTVDRFAFRGSAAKPVEPVKAWTDREHSENTLRSYLADYPSTVTFVSGPVGSGKTSLMHQVVKESNRKAMVIDCSDLFKGGSDSSLLSSLARQTGYWPLFTMANQVGGLVDLAAVGLIGQKTGYNATLEQQVRDMLQVVASGLQGVASAHTTDVKRQEERQRRRIAHEEHRAELLERVERGAFHDGRIDCVAGNGVMSELGLGDEPVSEKDYDAKPPAPTVVNDEQGRMDQDVKFLPATQQDRLSNVPENIKALPVIIIKNFAARDVQRAEILDAIAEWTRTLVDNQIAHVVVLSDNRENSKRLAKAMPNRPLTSVALSDADADSAVTFVTTSLSKNGGNMTLTKDQISNVQLLGGRASDLQTLIHKMKSGQGVEDAVNDIISRGVSELRKNAFGDDLEDAKSLLWTREQAWAVVKKLAEKPDLSYFDTLLEFPFKGDETALRAMEHAELIAIHAHEGRPSSIRPGRPVYKVVFQRLVGDSIFQATQELAFNEKAIASAEKTVHTCEAELQTLRELSNESYMSRAAKHRAKYLSSKMQEAQTKIEALEGKNVGLKKVISHGR
ncbi:exonuclease [Auriculariales sp. MPI-PUGE-AT-0066]|nr:exonuclease [Auriculariales sp. MPI-PUGE-AT-0066]